jgi:hypothetical protein
MWKMMMMMMMMMMMQHKPDPVVVDARLIRCRTIHLVKRKGSILANYQGGAICRHRQGQRMRTEEINGGNAQGSRKSGENNGERHQQQALNQGDGPILAACDLGAALRLSPDSTTPKNPDAPRQQSKRGLDPPIPSLFPPSHMPCLRLTLVECDA